MPVESTHDPIADADPETVGAAAHAGNVILSELRAAEGEGLEGLFLSLTSAGEVNDR